MICTFHEECERTASRRTLPFEDNCYENVWSKWLRRPWLQQQTWWKRSILSIKRWMCVNLIMQNAQVYIYTYFTNLSKCQIILGIGFPQVLLRLELVPPPIRNCSKMPSASDHLRWGFGFTRSGAERFGTIYLGVSKNRGTPKWMVYNGKAY